MADWHAHVVVWFINQQGSQYRPLNLNIMFVLENVQFVHLENRIADNIVCILKVVSQVNDRQIKVRTKWCVYHMFLCLLQKPANILVMGEGPERGRVKIGKVD